MSFFNIIHLRLNIYVNPNESKIKIKKAFFIFKITSRNSKKS